MGVRGMLKKCYMVFQGCYSGVSRVLKMCYRVAKGVLKGFFRGFPVYCRGFTWFYKDVTIYIQGCYSGVPGV